ncbi:MAG TPA: hypothetical protein PL155_06635 [Candidatus Omnitrophota bacterium]|nr:hypothetical protein [Candidatus Omnitrophota bacterium]HPD83845.1 hypothetical protein [Candidatus Omnitrophota bacterium]HRZ02702.1 hypothetical protein [Candidatus Omnitrophota bacterium]
MTKDEIYEHLAQVYLGKKQNAKDKRRRKNKFHPDAELLLKVLIAVVVLSSVFYGFTAFLSKKNGYARSSVLFALSNSPIRIKYDLREPFPQVSSFSIPIPKINASKYSRLTFSIRGLDEGTPGMMKVVLKNKKNEVSFYFIKGVGEKWQKFSIPLSEFSKITDWYNLTDVSFVFEAWNAEDKRGAVLIDDVCFAS